MTTAIPKISAWIAFFIAIEIMCIFYIDQPVSAFFRTLETNHSQIIDIFRAYTDLGKAKWYLWPSGTGIIICVLLLHLRQTRLDTAMRLSNAGKNLLYFFICIAASGIITDLLKIIIGRARPVEFDRHSLYGFHPFSLSANWHAMPSGHATTAATLAIVLSQIIPRYRFLWFLAALLLIVSRFAVNAHYPGDVLAGCCVAFLTITAVKNLWHRHGINLAIQRFFPIDKRHRDI